MSPVSNECCHIRCKGLLNSAAHFCSKITGKWSGLGAESLFIFSISVTIISSVKSISVNCTILGSSETLKNSLGFPILLFTSGSEKLDEYWCSSFSDISLGRVISCSSILNGPMVFSSMCKKVFRISFHINYCFCLFVISFPLV
ncbi:unnamed protein product [Meganyctiphanes norvegica]|uniref:Uncharacterized protein n=1 Tax=Meganyctiphanes norvegica TaxID=48144 RepID=A0AAV2QW48_MEGNR